MVSRGARVGPYVDLEAGSLVRSGRVRNTLVMGEGSIIDLGSTMLEDSIVGRACRIAVRSGGGRLRLVVGDRVSMLYEGVDPSSPGGA